MTSVVIAAGSFVGFIVAYYTYGRWLARRVFRLDPAAQVPAYALRDDKDFVPTRKEVVFGHHFTSIAGTGPIVGPAIAVFWGWLPALLWVLLGSVFMGAMHDFGALVVSMRHRGQTVGEIIGRLVHPRTRILFLAVMFLLLMIVIAIFGLVIALIFAMYPGSVFAVWIQIPLAVAIGILVYRRSWRLLPLSVFVLAVMYGSIWIGQYYVPLDLASLLHRFVPGYAALFAGSGSPLTAAVVTWTALLLVYCFIASVLPVWLLLQPRDYINSHQLFVAMGLLLLGLFVAHPAVVAPAVNPDAPRDAPPIIPFLFITVACGAISGFHSLVSSGTSSKQVRCEPDAQMVGYGSMLMEAALAVLVILACCAGLGMGIRGADGAVLTGSAAWTSRYSGSWASMTLAKKLSAFVDGGANVAAAVGVPAGLAVGIMAVVVACFAMTTLDTATRLQRYVIAELFGALKLGRLANKYLATALAVGTAGAVAMTPGPLGPGSGGKILWPLFGAGNQLLAGLALLVITFYLARQGRRVWMVVIPMVVMLVIPGWAMWHQVVTDWAPNGKRLLTLFGMAIGLLQIWIVLEALLAWRRMKRAGVSELDRPAPPAPARSEAGGSA